MFIAQHPAFPPSLLVVGLYLLVSVPVTFILSVIALVFVCTARRTRRSTRTLCRVCLALSTCNVIGVFFVMTQIHFMVDTSTGGVLWPLGFALGFIFSQVSAFLVLSQTIHHDAAAIPTAPPDA